jgi:hypothetical protein
MYTFQDPFAADTAKYKKMLDEDSQREPEVRMKTADEILSNSTVPGLPPSVYRAIKDQQAKLDADKEKKNKVAQAFNQLFEDLNQKYGLNVHFTFDDYNQTLSYMIEPTNARAMELYISDAYSKFRVMMYGQFLNSLALLSAQILDPAYLLSESMTYDQKLDTMERLFSFMNTMEEINEKIHISDVPLKLEKLTSDQRPTYKLDDPRVRQFMEDTFNETKQIAQKPDEQ